MRLLGLLAAALLAAAPLAAEDKKDEKKGKDEEAIVGTWKVDKLDAGGLQGEKLDAVAKLRLAFRTDGKLTAVHASGYEQQETDKLDPAAKPQAIDMAGDGHTRLGVYALDGDILTIGGASAGEPRPTELKADGKGVVVVTLKRVKGDVKKDK